MLPVPSEHDVIPSILIGDEHGDGAAAARSRHRRGRRSFTKRRLGFGFWISVGWLVLVIALALLAPVLPLAPSPTRRSTAPAAAGSRWTTRSAPTTAAATCSRARSGVARVSLLVGFTSIAFALVIGGTIGLIAGFYRGWTEKIDRRELRHRARVPGRRAGVAVDHVPRPAAAVDPARDRHPRGRARRSARAREHARLRATRVRHRQPRARGQEPPHHLAGDLPERPRPDGRLGAARHGARDRRRGIARLPRAERRGLHARRGAR